MATTNYPVLEAILKELPDGWKIKRLLLGENWTLSVVASPAGEIRAGLAATPGPADLARQDRFIMGDNSPDNEDALALAQNILATEPVAAAVGLATINALLKPDPALLSDLDAADWLAENGQGKKVALVGRFPFIHKIQPQLAALWVLELDPHPGEYSAEQAPDIIPQAGILAITSSALINHTLDGLLAAARPGTKIMLLGPSTPLSPALFHFGIELLSGVQVADLEAVTASVQAGVNFRKMAGVRRVTLMNKPD